MRVTNQSVASYRMVTKEIDSVFWDVYREYYLQRVKLSLQCVFDYQRIFCSFQLHLARSRVIFQNPTMRVPSFILVFSIFIYGNTGVSKSGEDVKDLWNKISYSSSQSSV